MRTLAIDTAAAACQACIHDSSDDRICGLSVEIIGRGHAERLMAVIDAALAEASLDLRDIDRIAVTVGPGSFTGIRVGVATARGLALALGLDCVGVGSLEAIGLPAVRSAARPVLAVIDARRGEVYAQLFGADGSVASQATALPPGAAARLAAKAGAALAGSGAGIVAAELPDQSDLTVIAGEGPIDIAAVVRIAARRSGSFEKPAPLYLRGADAKPQTGFAVARKE